MPNAREGVLADRMGFAARLAGDSQRKMWRWLPEPPLKPDAAVVWVLKGRPAATASRLSQKGRLIQQQSLPDQQRGMAAGAHRRPVGSPAMTATLRPRRRRMLDDGLAELGTLERERPSGPWPKQSGERPRAPPRSAPSSSGLGALGAVALGPPGVGRRKPANLSGSSSADTGAQAMPHFTTVSARCLSFGTLPGAGSAAGPARVAIVRRSQRLGGLATKARLACAGQGLGADCWWMWGGGLQRLLGTLAAVAQARVLIACAGMEGALSPPCWRACCRSQ